MLAEAGFLDQVWLVIMSEAGMKKKALDKVTEMDGLLYVPNHALQVQALQWCHDSHLAGHYGLRKTQELMSRSFW